VATPALCVIFNPSAGRGRAGRRLARLRRLLGAKADYQPTQGPGHAQELAFQAARSGVAVVAAAGGDGTVHEVANGILRAGRPEVALAVIPVGSANDYAYSLDQPGCWREGKTGERGPRPVDVGWVRSASGRERYFVNGLGLGFNGAVTLESRRISRLQGVALYGCAVLRALWYRYDSPPMAITLDGQTRQGPTLALTVAIGRREGNFLMAPEAQLDDGLFDILLAGPLSRWELLRCFPGMVSGKLPKNHPALWTGRCQQLTLSSEKPLAVHTDGELFCVPEDQVRNLEIGILPKRLLVQAW
jgi:diacylglycerol kinase family enzyme